MQIASAFETKIESLLAQWINGASSTFITALAPLALAAFTVYITLLGWQIMRGEATEPLHHILKRLLKLAVIGAIAVGPLGYYQTYVIGLSTSATGAMVAGFTNGTAITVGGVVDNVMTPYTNLWNLMMQNAQGHMVPDFALIVSAVFVAIAEFCVVVVALGFYLLAKIELALCLAVGPVFVLMAAFEATVEWTKRWIGQLWHYSLQIGLITACVSVLQGSLIDETNKAYTNYQSGGAASVFSDVLAILCISVCVVVVLWNIGALSQALSGAVGSIGHGSVQGAAKSGGQAVANQVGSLAMRAATAGASKALTLGRRALGRSGGNQLALPGPSTAAGGAGNVPAAQAYVTENL